MASNLFEWIHHLENPQAAPGQRQDFGSVAASTGHLRVVDTVNAFELMSVADLDALGQVIGVGGRHEVHTFGSVRPAPRIEGRAPEHRRTRVRGRDSPEDTSRGSSASAETPESRARTSGVLRGTAEAWRLRCLRSPRSATHPRSSPSRRSKMSPFRISSMLPSGPLRCRSRREARRSDRRG